MSETGLVAVANTAGHALFAGEAAGACGLAGRGHVLGHVRGDALAEAVGHGVPCPVGGLTAVRMCLMQAR
jgi:hypothetical protein